MFRGRTLLKALIAGVLAVGLVLGFLLFGSQEPAPAATSLTAVACQDPGETIVGGDTAGVPNGWGPDVVAAAKAARIRASIMGAQLEAESGWNPRIVSPVGAQGLAQFMPATWATFGNSGDPFNPKDAIAAQGRYMGALRGQVASIAKDTGVDVVDLVIAGYNAGPGAVQMYNGVPPFGETQSYVAKIKALATTKYKALDGSKPGKQDASAVVDAGCGGTTKAVGAGDDLPWPHAAVGAPSPLGMYNRECVDFALWRINQLFGATKPPFKFTNANFRGDGQLLGSANSIDGGGGLLYSWKDGWDVKGWPKGHVPQVSAVVYYAPEPGNPYGHVAWVKSVNKDGTFLEEGYNIDLDGNGPNHNYYTRTMKASQVSWFLYIPDKSGISSEKSIGKKGDYAPAA